MNKICSGYKRKTISIATISLFIISMLSIFSTVPLALAQPTLTLNPTSGPPGTIVTITGSGFTPYTYYRVYFDRDGDSSYDYGEPYITVRAGAAGTFATTLTIPSVPSGTYYIRTDTYPYTAPAIASAPFTVKTIWDKLLDIEGLIDDIEAKLDGTISSLITTINSKLGTFSGTDTVASLLYDIETKLDDTTRWVSDADLSSAVSTIISAIDSAKTSILSAVDGAKNAILSAISDAQAKLDDIIAKPSFTGTFDGSYTDDPAFDPNRGVFIAVNSVIGTGTGTIDTTSVSFTFEGYLVSDWGHYSALGKGALVTGRFNITTSDGDQIHIEIEGIQREVWVDNSYTEINHLTGTYTIITGTGEYKGATGSGTIVADINTIDKTFGGHFGGIIKY